MRELLVRRLGPLRDASVGFGDLTVLVGPQATGKSLFLQMLRLALDAPAIRATLANYGSAWRTPAEFLELYLGEGCGSLAATDPLVEKDGHPLPLEELAAPPTAAEALGPSQRLFYIPAQRVLSMSSGLPRPFTEYGSRDPFCLRDYSAALHRLVQTEFALGPFFPRTNRLKRALRDLVAERIYPRMSLRIEAMALQKRVVLVPEGAGRDERETAGHPSLPFLVWSAGQREFTPLLLGLYWLLPPGGASRRQDLEWVVIEEPEMGLHPRGIGTVMALVLELLNRGYRVCLSTHAPAVLDVVWGLRFLADAGATPRDVQELLGLRNTGAQEIARAALAKEYRTYYFGPEGRTRDISSLDPGDEAPEVAGWGGLSGFSNDIGAVVARVARRGRRAAG
ncbi:MAG: ATP-binding protein [Gammaproteobacteria bacterium]|nr:MAG: ATP-binding protein [Gammaproteobacteria bacterium]